MPPLNIHPADPNHPKGMAWVLAAGFPDPREGSWPNQQLCIIQGWEPFSEQLWDFGFRWHPELQKKWVTGGGQFSVGEITTTKPEVEETIESGAEELLEMLSAEQPEFVSEIRRVAKEGTPAEREAALKNMGQDVLNMMKILQFLEKTET